MLKLTFSFQSLQSNLNNATREHPEHLDSMGLSGQGGWDAAIASRKTRQSVLCELCFRDMRKEAQWEVPPLIFFRQTSFTASLYSTVNSKPTGKKKKHSLPKETKKGKNKQRNGSSCSEAPTGLSHHEQGGPSLPTHTLPPSAGGGLEPAVPSLGGRLPGCTEGGGPALRPPPRLQVGTAPRLGTLPSAVPFLGCCPSLVVPPPSAPLLFFFRIKITVLPPSEVLRCVPLGLKYQQPEQLKLPLAREK